MFISLQTYEGIQITVHSFKEVCKFLLEHGVPYILSERFCQDDLENYFGRQRAIGSRRSNPSVRDAGYNDNTIKTQCSVRSIVGNVQSQRHNFNEISDLPLPKMKKKVLDSDYNPVKTAIFIATYINDHIIGGEFVLVPL